MKEHTWTFLRWEITARKLSDLTGYSYTYCASILNGHRHINNSNIGRIKKAITTSKESLEASIKEIESIEELIY